MDTSARINRGAINGRAVFAAAAFLVGAGLAIVATRVGVSVSAAATLAGLLAMPGLALIGLLTRTTQTAGFFAADRGVPAAYGGLAAAAFAAGLVLAASVGGPPLAALALGAAMGALVVGPLVRRANATSLADFFAMRFGGRALRWILSVPLAASGALIALAGFESAADSLASAGIVGRARALLIVGAWLVLLLAPGGLAGVLWGAAACAGALLLALAIAVSNQFAAAPDTALDWLGAALAAGLGGFGRSAPLVAILAGALGAAALPLWAEAGAGSRNAAQATRAGLWGAVFAAAIGFGVEIARAAPAGPATGALCAGCVALTGLALAAGGVHGATRAFAVGPGLASGRPEMLASQRLAAARGGALLLILICGMFLHARPVSAADALEAAVFIALAFVAPVFGLSFSQRAVAAHALLCLLASAATLGLLAKLQGVASLRDHWAAAGLAAAALGFSLGWAATLFARPGATQRARHDSGPFPGATNLDG